MRHRFEIFREGDTVSWTREALSEKMDEKNGKGPFTVAFVKNSPLAVCNCIARTRGCEHVVTCNTMIHHPQIVCIMVESGERREFSGAWLKGAIPIGESPFAVLANLRNKT